MSVSAGLRKGHIAWDQYHYTGQLRGKGVNGVIFFRFSLCFSRPFRVHKSQTLFNILFFSSFRCCLFPFQKYVPPELRCV